MILPDGIGLQGLLIVSSRMASALRWFEMDKINTFSHVHNRVMERFQSRVVGDAMLMLACGPENAVDRPTMVTGNTIVFRSFRGKRQIVTKREGIELKLNRDCCDGEELFQCTCIRSSFSGSLLHS